MLIILQSTILVDENDDVKLTDMAFSLVPEMYRASGIEREGPDSHLGPEYFSKKGVVISTKLQIYAFGSTYFQVGLQDLSSSFGSHADSE